jgi:hypothetical protein
MTVLSGFAAATVSGAAVSVSDGPAAHAPAIVSQANATPQTHRNAPGALRVPPVEFIYTPNGRRLDNTFNDLCSASWSAQQRVGTKASRILTAHCRRRRALTRFERFPLAPRRGKTSHNGDCVTLEPRRRYNMSHRRHDRSHWHACCLYNIQERRRCPSGRKASKLADSNKTWIWNEPSSSSGTAWTGQE